MCLVQSLVPRISARYTKAFKFLLLMSWYNSHFNLRQAKVFFVYTKMSIWMKNTRRRRGMWRQGEENNTGWDSCVKDSQWLTVTSSRSTHHSQDSDAIVLLVWTDTPTDIWGSCGLNIGTRPISSRCVWILPQDSLYASLPEDTGEQIRRPCCTVGFQGLIHVQVQDQSRDGLSEQTFKELWRQGCL